MISPETCQPSMVTGQASMATRQVAQATDIPKHEMIDTSAFDRSQLFIADNDLMTNDVSHQNTSVAPCSASMATRYCYRGNETETRAAPVANPNIECETVDRITNLKVPNRRQRASTTYRSKHDRVTTHP